MKFILLGFLLLSSAFAAGDSSADWTPVKNRAFSFSVPASFKKTETRGIDSFVEEYAAEGIRVTFDFGLYSNNFNDWPKDTKFELRTVNGKPARIGVVQHEFHTGFPYSAQIYIKVDDRRALSMFAACRSEKEVTLARQIFLTIVVNEKKN